MEVISITEGKVSMDQQDLTSSTENTSTPEMGQTSPSSQRSSKAKRTSRSRKSSSAAKAPASKPFKGRLNRILKLTPVEFKAADEEDLGYYYYAYQLGALSKFDTAFHDVGTDLSPIEFNELFLDTMAKRDRVATYFGKNKKGNMVPIGFVGLGQSFEYFPKFEISEMVWFPETSDRQKMASALNLINELRDEALIVAYADTRDPSESIDGVGSQAFYTHLCKYGVMRRVGKLEDFYGPGITAAIFQSKRRKN